MEYRFYRFAEADPGGRKGRRSVIHVQCQNVPRSGACDHCFSSLWREGFVDGSTLYLNNLNLSESQEWWLVSLNSNQNRYCQGMLLPFILNLHLEMGFKCIG